MSDVPSEKIKKVLENLQRNEMESLYFSSSKEAREEVLKRVPPDCHVGIGGSITLRDMGLLEELARRGNEIYDHWGQDLTPGERREMLLKQQRSECFLTSTNAVTMDGKLINVDATGNRVTSMICGPARVIVVTGVNKIVKNVHEGLARLKKVAAPKNCQRRKDPTPCAQDLTCHDCDTNARLCRVTTIIERKPWAIKDFAVILIGEELGY